MITLTMFNIVGAYPCVRPMLFLIRKISAGSEIFQVI
jgi:hypothetical protein